MPVQVISGATQTKNATVLWQAVKPIVSASGSAEGYPAISATDPATWSSWRPDAANGWIQYDLGSAVSVDGVGISAHNMFSSGVTSVTVQHSTNGTTWINVGVYTPLSNDDVFIVFGAVTFRYWRVQLSGPAANLGVVVIGKRLVFPHAPIDSYVPLHQARQYTKLFNESRTGNFLGNRVMGVGADTEVDMGFVDRAFVEGPLLPFKRHYDMGGCFFYASCPATIPMDIGYCHAGDDSAIIDVTFIEADKLASISFSLHSYVGA